MEPTSSTSSTSSQNPFDIHTPTSTNTIETTSTNKSKIKKNNNDDDWWIFGSIGALIVLLSFIAGSQSRKCKDKNKYQSNDINMAGIKLDQRIKNVVYS